MKTRKEAWQAFVRSGAHSYDNQQAAFNAGWNAAEPDPPVHDPRPPFAIARDDAWKRFLAGYTFGRDSVQDIWEDGFSTGWEAGTEQAHAERSNTP